MVRVHRQRGTVVQHGTREVSALAVAEPSVVVEIGNVATTATAVATVRCRSRRQETDGLDLFSLMIGPVQHFPRYRGLLEEIQRSAPARAAACAALHCERRRRAPRVDYGRCGRRES